MLLQTNKHKFSSYRSMLAQNCTSKHIDSPHWLLDFRTSSRTVPHKHGSTPEGVTIAPSSGQFWHPSTTEPQVCFTRVCFETPGRQHPRGCDSSSLLRPILTSSTHLQLQLMWFIMPFLKNWSIHYPFIPERSEHAQRAASMGQVYLNFGDITRHDGSMLLFLYFFIPCWKH